MSLVTLPSNIAMRIVSRPAVKLAGIKIRTAMHTVEEDVKKLWHDVMPQISQSASGEKDATYGVSWVVDPQACSFDYCAAVKQGTHSVMPDEFEETLIPAGLYAECSLPSRDDLYQFYHYLFSEWLPDPKDGAGISDTPCYEVYPDNFGKGGHMKLYIPVVCA